MSPRPDMREHSRPHHRPRSEHRPHYENGQGQNSAPPPPPRSNGNNRTAVGDLDIEALRKMKVFELQELAKKYNIIEGISGLKKQDLIFRILQSRTDSEGVMYGQGIL